VSSSACEWNWSSYSYVHNKSQNKLATTRAVDLVYVYNNSKVVAASKEKDEKNWYKENVESEESEAESDVEDVEDGPHPTIRNLCFGDTMTKREPFCKTRARSTFFIQNIRFLADVVRDFTVSVMDSKDDERAIHASCIICGHCALFFWNDLLNG